MQRFRNNKNFHKSVRQVFKLKTISSIHRNCKYFRNCLKIQLCEEITEKLRIGCKKIFVLVISITLNVEKIENRLDINGEMNVNESLILCVAIFLNDTYPD